MQDIIFCDINKNLEIEIEKQFPINNGKYHIEAVTKPIYNIIGNNMAYFSPANSFLTYGGGVDKVYRNMFPKLQNMAQNKLKTYNIMTKNGRYFLPLGSAMIIDLMNGYHIVSCPTMYIPQSIKGTHNVYWAFLAGLYCIEKYNKNVPVTKQIKTLVVPGLGTGIGSLTFSEAVTQMVNAFNDFLIGKNNFDKLSHDCTIYVK